MRSIKGKGEGVGRRTKEVKEVKENKMMEEDERNARLLLMAS